MTPPVRTRVLVVDDSSADRRLIAALLAGAPSGAIEATCVATLHEGLSELASGHYDCVLLDIDLKNSDNTATDAGGEAESHVGNGDPGARQALEGIRAVIDAAHDVAVVVMADSDGEGATETFALGAQDHLVKIALNVDSLSRSVRYAIERCHLQGALESALGETRSALSRLELSDHSRRLIMDSMHEGLIHLDPTGVIVGANRVAAKLLELSVEDLIGLRSSELGWLVINEDGCPSQREDHPSVRAQSSGRPVEGVLGITRTGADVRWIDIHAEPLFENENETVTGLVMTMDDMTAERDGAERLAASEHRYRTLSELCPDPIFVIAPDNRYLYANEAAGRLIGHPAAELIGSYGDYRPIEPNGEVMLNERRRRTLAGETVMGSLESYANTMGELSMSRSVLRRSSSTVSTACSRSSAT